MILDMRRSRANLPNRCCRQIDRIAYRAFDGKQSMDREGRAATTGNTYCGNLLWQSSLLPTMMQQSSCYQGGPSLRDGLCEANIIYDAAGSRVSIFCRCSDAEKSTAPRPFCCSTAKAGLTGEKPVMDRGGLRTAARNAAVSKGEDRCHERSQALTRRQEGSGG